MDLTFKTASAIVESSFLPLSCRCSHDSASARIHIYDAVTGEPVLLVAGINTDQMGTDRGVSRLVAELRDELKFARMNWPHAPDFIPDLPSFRVAS